MNKGQIGVSTASLFKRMYNEESVAFLSASGVRTAEVFLGTYREYKVEFARLLNERRGDMDIHSVHTLNTHFEPQLFSANPRALEDAYEIAEEVLSSAQLLGARYYTFHGVARIKRKIAYTDYAVIGEKYRVLTEKCAKYGVSLALENVEWAHCNHPGFFSGVKKYAPLLKATLDVKQARDSGDGYLPFLNEMGEDIVTVHLSDIDDSGKLCLPGRGTFDFAELFRRLEGVGFKGKMMIEVYNENYARTDELIRSYEHLCSLAEKIR
ncbi:MAG: sugar phosphate isomerase/epimerase [Clostridia bacterium]|nr:sugar phosphate isomerase/epimerase [Clostridia bacterium]